MADFPIRNMASFVHLTNHNWGPYRGKCCGGSSPQKLGQDFFRIGEILTQEKMVIYPWNMMISLEQMVIYT